MKGIISLFVFNILSSKTHNFKDVLEGLAVLIVQRVLLIEGRMSRVPELPASLPTYSLFNGLSEQIHHMIHTTLFLVVLYVLFVKNLNIQGE